MTTVDFANSYQADFERLEQDRSGDPEWLRQRRREAFEQFTEQGFPTTRQEEWRFTNVGPIADATFRLADTVGISREQITAYSFAADGLDEAVVVNGRFVPALSSLGTLPTGVQVLGLDEAWAAAPGRLAAHLARYADTCRQPFTALNTAFLGNGVYIELPANVVLERPLHVLFVSASPDGAACVSHPRTLVVASRNTQLRLVESYVTVAADGAPAARSSFTNAVTELAIEDGAVLEHYRLQREARSAYHVATTQVHLGHSSTYSSIAFAFGGALVRHDVNAVLSGEGGDCTLNGLYVADGSRLIDNHTFIDHAKPHCSSHEIYKGILSDKSRAVFNGKILVRPDAQKTDAKQTNKTLLLSDDAQINTKPQLEIYANDVKCTHGATVGQLSADALFYLQARGIGRDDAQRMLVRAFAADIAGRVRIDAVRSVLDRVLDTAMEGR